MSKTKNIQVGLLAAALIGGGTPGSAYLSGLRMPRARRDRGPDYRLPKSRELARIAWRARVDEAMRRYGEAVGLEDAYCKPPRFTGRGYGLQGLVDESEYWATRLREALVAPKPWRKPRRPADRGRCYCLRRGRPCGGYCEMDGVCPECWNDPRGVRPHDENGDDDCPTASSYAIGDTGDYGWTCECPWVRCPGRCGRTPPKHGRARLRRKRRAAQRRRAR